MKITQDQELPVGTLVPVLPTSLSSPDSVLLPVSSSSLASPACSISHTKWHSFCSICCLPLSSGDRSKALPEAWFSNFAFCVNEFWDPNSFLSKMYPHLHAVIRDRLNAVLAAKGNDIISRCTHHIKGTMGRTDSSDFQLVEDWVLDSPEGDTVGLRSSCLCPALKDRMEIYGHIGSGTFGSVYIARERNSAKANPDDLQHFAIKVERHKTLQGCANGAYADPPVGPLLEETENRSIRLIPTEALILLLLTTGDRFPTLDSVYTHGPFQATVMSACVDHAVDRVPPHARDYKSQFPAFTGRYLMAPDNKPLLDEMQACKVASQLLEGMVHMAEMNVWHRDLSVNNYIVDQNLNVQIIDLGLVDFGLEEEDFLADRMSYIPYQEYQMSPELATELTHECWQTAIAYSSTPEINVILPHDVRQTSIWKFAVTLYGILHGFWPWDEPEIGNQTVLTNYMVDHSDPRIVRRRHRIIHEDLPISEHLSQDCVDVLQALFRKNPAERPSLEELVSFPWFQQWAFQDRVYARPFSQAFTDDFFSESL